ncbi:MAG: DUF4249 domain-containing protein, partial [Bacteroidales bacterium]|nr:DUF4249 domain-containing protein [Bacteroidales bacterium]
GAVVTITDDDGSVTTLTESPPGTYCTDSLLFRGRVGASYSLRVLLGIREYETGFMEMKPVPPIDSLYYEKVLINDARDTINIDEGAHIYADTQDPSGKCLYYKWDYTETWEFRIPYAVTKRVCYVTEKSDRILIKNTEPYSQAKVTRFPVTFITHETDRLKERYSILLRQYSLNEQEYNFWERVSDVSQEVGNLYDVTPSAIAGNIRSCSDPDETVLGYFSVSAVSEKRLFIKDHFFGLPHFFTYCATDTLGGALPSTGFETDYWVIEDYSDEIPPFWIITTYKECADCTIRGTSEMPPFWRDYLKDK